MSEYRRRVRVWLNRRLWKRWSVRRIQNMFEFAAASVLIGTACVAAIQTLVGFPPLLFYVASVAAAAIWKGISCGLLTMVLATLASDFFFVDPVLTFSLNDKVMALSLNYIVGGGMALLFSHNSNYPRK